jgi:hypothetical protein
VVKGLLFLGSLILGISPALAAPLPLVTEWLDETGQEVIVAYGVTRATNRAEIDRDKATLIARANLAAYLGRTVVSGSVVIREWRHVGGDRNGGLEIVAVEWSEANARAAAGIPR